MSLQLSTKLNPNPGFHPTFTTVISGNSPPQHSKCSIYLHFVLPPLVFVDPYELETNYADKYSFHLVGHRSLELPVIAVDRGQSHLLLNVSMSLAAPVETELEISTPMHLRYGDLSPSEQSGYAEVDVMWPQGFMVCKDGREHDTTMNHLPSELASLFQPEASFIPILHSSLEGSPLSSFTTKLRVPVGNLNHTTQVELAGEQDPAYAKIRSREIQNLTSVVPVAFVTSPFTLCCRYCQMYHGDIKGPYVVHQLSKSAESRNPKESLLGSLSISLADTLEASKIDARVPFVDIRGYAVRRATIRAILERVLNRRRTTQAVQ